MALIMPNGSYTVNKPFAQPFGAPPGSMPTPSKPGPGRPSAPMQPQGMAPSKPAVPMPQYGQPGGGTTNRFDGSGWASDGTRIPAGGPADARRPPAKPSVPMMQNYAPGQAQPQQSPWAASTRYPQRQRQQPRTQEERQPVQLADPRLAQQGPQMPGGYPMPRHAPRRQPPRFDGVYAAGTSQEYMAQNPDTVRFGQGPGIPPPFQANTLNFDGTQSQMPNFQQRDAFISQINNQLGQMQQQSWQRPGMGAPQFNFPQMWGQAGEMANQGFRNPFAAPPQRMMSPSALADLAPGWQNRPPPPPPPPGVYY